MALPLVWMADELRAAGLAPVELTGWKTRSDVRNVYSSELAPIGLINHHTAGASILYNYPEPPYWTDTRLAPVCNITIRPDGTLSVLSAGIAYDSGKGSRKVYDAVRNDRPLPPLAGLTSDMNGTLHFIDIEVQHLGNGSPIDPRQHKTLIKTNAVICKHYGWNPMTRLIGHREWAPDRKTDPRWNGSANPMPGIRIATKQAMEEDMSMTGPENWDQADWDALDAHAIGFASRPGGPNNPTPWQMQLRTKANTDLILREVTVLSDAELTEMSEAVADEIARRAQE